MKFLWIYVAAISMFGGQCAAFSDDSVEDCIRHAAKKSTQQNLSSALFLKTGFAQTMQSKRRGTSAKFTCNHIGIGEGNPRISPHVELHWFRGNVELLSGGRVNITGCKKSPFVLGSKVIISNLTKDDEGDYSCKLWFQGGYPGDPPIFEEDFTLTVEGYPDFSTVNSSGEADGLLDTKLDLTAVYIGVILACTLALVLLPAICCLRMRTGETNSCLRLDMWVTCKRLLRLSVKENESANPESAVFFIRNSGEERRTLVSNMENMRKAELDTSCKRYLRVFPFLSEVDVKEIADIEIQRERLHCNLEHSMPIILGTGNFGQVYAGTILNSKGTLTPVAVKRLNDGFSTDELGNFLREVVTLMRAGQHINVISLLATIVLDTLERTEVEEKVKVHRPPIIVMELATGGNLRKFLHDNRFNFTTSRTAGLSFSPKSTEHKVLEMENLISFGYQVARGMEHLTSKNILHRDLAARNVLLTDQMVVKIADFGLSKFMTDEKQYYRVNSQGITPAKWTAPESLWTSKFAVKSDVWSYGVLLWEILTLGDQPYASIPACKLYEYLSAGNRLKRPFLATFEMHEIMLTCWAWDPNMRPDFTTLVQKMTDILLSVSNQSYIDFTNPRERLPGCSGQRDSELSCATSTLTETTSFDSSSEVNFSTSLETVISVKNSANGSDSDLNETPREATIVYEIMNPLYEGQAPEHPASPAASYINDVGINENYSKME